MAVSAFRGATKVDFGNGEAAPGAQPDTPLQLLAFAEDAVPWLEDAWLIEDVLPEEGLAVIFGAPGSRKTFTAIDLALHIAAGCAQWREKRVERRLCMYLSLEGGRMFKNRLAAWRKHHDRGAPLFYRCAEKLDLRSSDADAERVIAAGKALMVSTGERVGLVVVDTLNRAMAGGNENAPEDMGDFVALCDAIARELRCLVLIVHHSGKNAAMGMRGHSSLLGAIDTEISLGKGVMTVTKQKEGRSGLEFPVELAIVELGTTPTGKMVTSCVAVEGGGGGDLEKAVTGRGLSGRAQQQALEALQQLVDEHGRPNPGGAGWPEPGRVRIVERAAFMDFLTGKMTNDSQRDRRRSAKSALDGLIDKGLVQTNADCLWVCR
jgi:AAA domain